MARQHPHTPPPKVVEAAQDHRSQEDHFVDGLIWTLLGVALTWGMIQLLALELSHLVP